MTALTYATELSRLLTAFSRLGYTVRATPTERQLVGAGRVLYAVPLTGDAVADCAELGVWLIRARMAAGVGPRGRA